MGKKRAILIVTALTAILALPGLSAASRYVYTWVDQDNIRHYSERPPKGIKATRIKTSVGKKAAASAEAADAGEANSGEGQDQQEEAIPHDQIAAAPKPKKNKEICERARYNFEILNERSRIKIKADDEKEARFLSEEEVNEQRAAAKEAVDRYC